jgi:excisionase family DNA binding protein
MKGPAMLKTREVAKILSVKPRTVAKWIRNGDLKAVKVGTNWRVRREDLDDFIASRPTSP